MKSKPLELENESLPATFFSNTNRGQQLLNFWLELILYILGREDKTRQVFLKEHASELSTHRKQFRILYKIM